MSVAARPRPAPGPVAEGEAADGVTVAFATVGCKLNQYDTTEVQTLLEARGFRTVDFEETAQLYVINTCTVTARADHSGRQAIRRALARNPDALVVVTGCYAQTNPGAIGAIPGVDLVLGTQDRLALPDLLDGLRKRVRPLVRVSPVARASALASVPLPRFAPGYARAFVKVQDGCQHRCSFCVVPLARGPSRSRAVASVLAQVETLVEAGYAEVVLTGVDLGHYGWDLAPRTTLAALVRGVLAIPGLGRLRLSSILPAYFTPGLVETLAAEPRICRHLHVPLQSGSDRVLRGMRRPYNRALYARLVERLTEAMPGLGLGTDLITGFPGESDEEFEETVALVEALPFTYLHVFSYSDRRGTEAARSDVPRVAPDEIRRRTSRLRGLGEARRRAFLLAQVGRVLEVVVLGERDRATGRPLGLTDTYCEVALLGPETRAGRIVPVRVMGARSDRLEGVILSHA